MELVARMAAPIFRSRRHAARMHTQNQTKETARMLQKLIGLVFLLAATAAAADEDLPYSRLTVQFGPYVYHYNNDASHNELPWLAGLEWGPEGSWLDVGAVYFRNSFYQDSVYAYVSKRWFVMGERDKGTYLKVTGGPLWGYRGEFEHKVPFNHNGLGWAIIPGIGYQYRAVDAQLVFLGTAALMVTFGYDFYK
jgi:hypothetical protein